MNDHNQPDRTTQEKNYRMRKFVENFLCTCVRNKNVGALKHTVHTANM